MNKWLLVILLFLWSGHSLALNDPMKPPFFDGDASRTDQKTAARPLKLSMLLIAPGRKVAVINAQSVMVGDSVDGYRVLRIDENKVVLSGRGKVKELYLGGDDNTQKTKVENQRTLVDM